MKNFFIYFLLGICMTVVSVTAATFSCNSQVYTKYGLVRSPDYNTTKATTFDYNGPVNGLGCAYLYGSDGGKLAGACADVYTRTVVVQKEYDASHSHGYSGGI